MIDSDTIDNPKRRLMLASSGAVILGAGLMASTTLVASGGSSTVIDVSPNDASTLYTTLSNANSTSGNIVVRFAPGLYDLSSWSSAFTCSKSLSLQATSGNVVLSGNSNVDFMSVTNVNNEGTIIQAEGIEFCNWKSAVILGSTITELGALVFRKCRFIDLERGINSNSTNAQPQTEQFKRFVLDSCLFMSSDENNLVMEWGIRFGHCYKECLIVNSVFKNIVHRAISLTDSLDTAGAPHPYISNMRQNTVICENHITNISAPSGECQAIFLAGNRAVVSNNIVEYVNWSQPPANNDITGCEGIYLKCKHATISCNTMKNAGLNEAAILLKGDGIEEISGLVDGYGSVISGNVIVFDHSHVGTHPKTAGVSIHTDNVRVADNYIEGPASGIKTGSTKVPSNLDICGNSIVDFTKDGIKIAVKLEHYRIFGNSLRAKPSASNGVYGIFISLEKDPDLQQNTIKHVYVDANQVSLEAGQQSLSYGISFYRASGLTSVSLSGASICDNRITGFHRGIFINIKNGPLGATHAVMKDNQIYDILVSEVSSATSNGFVDGGNI